jgi:hypothetical protein
MEGKEAVAEIGAEAVAQPQLAVSAVPPDSAAPEGPLAAGAGAGAGAGAVHSWPASRLLRQKLCSDLDAAEDGPAHVLLEHKSEYTAYRFGSHRQTLVALAESTCVKQRVEATYNRIDAGHQFLIRTYLGEAPVLTKPWDVVKVEVETHAEEKKSPNDSTVEVKSTIPYLIITDKERKLQAPSDVGIVPPAEEKESANINFSGDNKGAGNGDSSSKSEGEEKINGDRYSNNFAAEEKSGSSFNSSSRGGYQREERKF